MRPNRDVLAKFFSKVQIEPAGCWLWTGSRSNTGYGLFPAPDLGRWAHRAAYTWFVEPIAVDRVIDHLCCNRACVNPAHLEAVTQQENILRGRRRRGLPGPVFEQLAGSPVHPGAILQADYFSHQPHGTKAAAARAMRLSDQHLNDVLVGRQPMSAKTCVLVAALTETSPEFWATLQARYDLWHAMQAIDTSTVQTFARDLARQASAKSRGKG